MYFMMRSGDIKKSVMDRSVKRVLDDIWIDDPQNPGVCFRCEGWILAAERLIYGIIHQSMAKGFIPGAISLDVILPGQTEEKELKELMKSVRDLCIQEEIKITSVRVSSSGAVLDCILFASVTEIKNKPAKVRAPQIEPADDLDVVVMGPVGCEGAALIAAGYREELRNRYAESYIRQAEKLYDYASMQDAMDILASNSVTQIYAAGEGGIFAAFWNLASRTEVGLDLRLKSIPIRQHTIEVCEYFNVNPYLLLSGGSFVLFCEKGQKLVFELEKSGIFSAVIGKTTRGKDRIIRYDDEIRFLEPPKADELYKVWRL